MGRAHLALCVALGAAPISGQADLAEVVAAELRAGRYAEALRRAGEAREPALAARLEADVRWTAGDLDGALAAAREGLSAAPRDLRLASTAADLALTLGLAAEARRHLDALDLGLAEVAAADGAGDGSSVEAEQWWRERRAGLEALTREAEASLAERDRALVRARAVGGGALAVAVLAFLRLLFGPRARRRGDRTPHQR